MAETLRRASTNLKEIDAAIELVFRAKKLHLSLDEVAQYIAADNAFRDLETLAGFPLKIRAQAFWPPKETTGQIIKDKTQPVHSPLVLSGVAGMPYTEVYSRVNVQAIILPLTRVSLADLNPDNTDITLEKQVSNAFIESAMGGAEIAIPLNAITYAELNLRG